jgi:hypothetical protein
MAAKQIDPSQPNHPPCEPIVVDIANLNKCYQSGEF